jgi:hypothetical protein
MAHHPYDIKPAGLLPHQNVNGHHHARKQGKETPGMGF